MNARGESERVGVLSREIGKSYDGCLGIFRLTVVVTGHTMPASSLLALIDDIATLLDDVATMSKVAVKNTAGVLGDDLALNAQQVTGLDTDRELPVVWRVGVGSLVNKAILVPAALLISQILPQAVIPLLMIGGIYLCFEGVEKLAHKFLHGTHEEDAEHADRLSAIADPKVDMVAFEQERIRGAIRTDFILSAEIIVITLGTVREEDFLTRLGVLVAISIIMTLGVYGLVAAIVKLDDAGLFLSKRQGTSVRSNMERRIGSILLVAAPFLMKFLSVAGTVAMFLVGGGIISHNSHWLHELAHHGNELVAHIPLAGPVMQWLFTGMFDICVGLLAGAAVLVAVETVRFLRKGTPNTHPGH